MADKRGLRNANISWTAWHTAGGDVYRLPSEAGSDEIRRLLRQHLSMPAVCIQLVETDPKTALCTWDGAESHDQRTSNDLTSNVALCDCCLDSLAFAPGLALRDDPLLTCEKCHWDGVWLCDTCLFSTWDNAEKVRYKHCAQCLFNCENANCEKHFHLLQESQKKWVINVNCMWDALEDWRTGA